jgi:hypothetical protein
MRGQQEVRVGTPIEQWPQLTPSQVLMLKQLNIYSVEDVASLSDENVRNVGPGGYKLRDDAARFLKTATIAVEAGKMEELQKQMAELAAANEGPGRAHRRAGEAGPTSPRRRSSRVSLLTACQAAVKETGVGEVPATIISNTDRSAVQLNALAERAAKQIMRSDWQALLREHTITTVASTEGYALPSDWARYVSQTAWDATNYWPMRGSITPPLAGHEARPGNAVQRAEGVPAARRLVLIMPTPTAVETLIIEYARNTPWINGSTYRVTATNDADTTVFPEYLLELEIIWRWLKAKGLDYAEEKLRRDGGVPRLRAGQPIADA